MSNIDAIAIGEFVRRQTKDSNKSHFEGSEEELLQRVRDNWDKQIPGYRDGVILVPVEPKGFFSPIVEVTEDTILNAEWISRREEEEKHISIFSRGDKGPAKQVRIVLYHKDVLEEGNERTTEADWEVISINADPTGDEVPMHPLTMARNFLVKTGGTKGNYSADQFAEAIWFWSQHVNVKKE